MAERIVVDANPLLSALLRGKAFDILYNKNYEFVTTEHTTWEVKKYIPVISETIIRKSDKRREFKNRRELEEALHSELERFPIKILHPKYYNHKLKLATKLIGNRDITDVDILALTLVADCPRWSEDRDFEGIPEIRLLKTPDLLKRLK